MSTDAKPVREQAADLIADGIRRHVNGHRTLVANQFAIQRVARQLSEEVEIRHLAECNDIEWERDELRKQLAERDATIEQLRAELAEARQAPAEIARRCALYRNFSLEAERDDRAEVWDSACKLAEEYAPAQVTAAGEVTP